MSEDFLGLFASETEVVSLPSGGVLFEKGEPGRLMYVVKSGNLQILDGNYVYETVSAGGIIGEMAVVDGSPRSATVRAIEPSVVVPVDERRFLFMVQQTPFFSLRVMRVMAGRLRMMNERAKVRE
jgi:CRP/FNR family transcriptional regulator, cyclic AMP receptor protein